MGYKKNKEPYPHELRERNQIIYSMAKAGISLAEIGRKCNPLLSRQRIFSICKEVEKLKGG